MLFTILNYKDFFIETNLVKDHVNICDYARKRMVYFDENNIQIKESYCINFLMAIFIILKDKNDILIDKAIKEYTDMITIQLLTPFDPKKGKEPGEDYDIYNEKMVKFRRMKNAINDLVDGTAKVSDTFIYDMKETIYNIIIGK